MGWYGLDGLYEPNNMIKPQQTNTESIPIIPVSWEAAFSDNRITLDTLMIYILDDQALKKEDVDIRQSFLQRYDLSLQDLQRLNWVLSYPPAENMKDIKMWPTYKSQ